MPYNSLIRVKEKICVSCGKPCFWFSRKRCQQCAKIEDFHAKEEKVLVEDNLQDLVNDLDVLVSRWVRLSAVDKHGTIQCYTCPQVDIPSEMDAGHYITRSCMYLRFDTARNIRCQCRICNRAKYGKAAIFGQNLEKEMPGVTEILLEESRIVHRWGRDELRSLIIEFTQKLKTLPK
jgi:Bacteriophage Lambda NinG protein